MVTKRMIELKNITKKFGNREVLRDINLSVNEGDIISIMGKSGSGKTTLLNIMGYFDKQTSGEYLFKNKKISSQYQMSKIRNMYMGFVFQAYNLIPKLTVKENILLPIYYSVDKKANRDRIKKIDDLLDAYELSHIANSYIENISGGEKQRTCMARAIVCDAKLIIADEPTGNLDKKNKNNVLKMFEDMNKKGKTIIIVTHDKDTSDIASVRYYLEEGRLHLQ